MLKKCIVVASFLFAIVCALPAPAAYLVISDASQVLYMTDGSGKVFFRNFDQFDSTHALGCCYNYWIDTNTVEGRNIFAMFLSYYAQAKPFRIWVPDSMQPGLIGAAGNY